MPNPTWNAGTADWTTAADWSTGAVPGAGDNVTVESGDGPPQVTTATSRRSRPSSTRARSTC